MSALEVIPIALWGFLLGFVGWGSSFRLVEPLADWLLKRTKNKGILQGIVRLNVTLFSICAMLLLLAQMPIFLSLCRFSGGEVLSDGHWRDAFAITYISSLVGFFALASIRRFQH